MLDTYNTASQTLSASGAVAFATNRVQTGCVATHAAGSTTISLNRPGLYKVDFNCDAATTTAAGNIAFQLQVNGNAFPGAKGTFYSAAPVNVGNIAFSAIVPVAPNCCAATQNVPTSLTVLASAASTVTNAEIVVCKVG